MSRNFAVNYGAFLILGSAFVAVMAIRHGDFLMLPSTSDLLWMLVAAPLLLAGVLWSVRSAGKPPSER